MKEELIEKIKDLKKQKNAVVLAHCYQNIEIDEVADFVGDSLYLSQMAKDTDADIIVFAGVTFMAETAKLLSPEKKVLLPKKEAGCQMADMIDAQALRKFKAEHPGVPAVCYVNSTAEVKAECDVCCTSSNAVNIIKKINAEEIIFVPDKNLSKYVAAQVPDKNIIIWEGFCPTHNKIKPENVLKIKALYPDALLLVHPECTPEVCALADFVGSTKQIIDFASGSDGKEFIVGTEMGVMYSLKKNNPDKKFYLMDAGLVCPNMKKTTLESVYRSLRDNIYEIYLDEEIIKKAKGCLEKMLELS